MSVIDASTKCVLTVRTNYKRPCTPCYIYQVTRTVDGLRRNSCSGYTYWRHSLKSQVEGRLLTLAVMLFNGTVGTNRSLSDSSSKGIYGLSETGRKGPNRSVYGHSSSFREEICCSRSLSLIRVTWILSLSYIL